MLWFRYKLKKVHVVDHKLVNVYPLVRHVPERSRSEKQVYKFGHLSYQACLAAQKLAIDLQHPNPRVVNKILKKLKEACIFSSVDDIFEKERYQLTLLILISMLHIGEDLTYGHDSSSSDDEDEQEEEVMGHPEITAEGESAADETDKALALESGPNDGFEDETQQGAPDAVTDAPETHGGGGDGEDEDEDEAGEDAGGDGAGDGSSDTSGKGDEDGCVVVRTDEMCMLCLACDC